MPRFLLALSAVSAGILWAAAPGAAEPRSTPGVQAIFEGRVIDLSEDWGEATACAEVDGYVECFRTEQAMDRYLATTSVDDSARDGGSRVRAAGDVSILATCSSSLRLYDATSFGGTVLNLSTRQTWINLSIYGFDNRTSSYQVGACDTYMAENNTGGGSWYPGTTSAGASSSTMVSGWDNRVSSVYIQ